LNLTLGRITKGDIQDAMTGIAGFLRVKHD
jgi:hypothetical protein